MSPRKTIAEYGPRGAKVRVFVEGSLARVQWREGGALRTKSYASDRAGQADAKAWAKGFADHRDRPSERRRLTLRELWDAFKASEFGHLRPNSKRIYLDGWTLWETMWGRHFIAEDATYDMMANFRVALDQRYAVSSVGGAIHIVKMVYRFGERTKAIGRNHVRLYLYKVAKEKRTKPPAEFRGDEFAKILAVLDHTKGGHWRPFVALTLCGNQGARQHAVLHLRWEDVDLERGLVTWRRQYDKQGNEWAQPLREASIAALAVAQARRGTSPWVIPSAKKGRLDQPYTIQSLWSALVTAESRAGITHQKQRGGHGLRRLLAGDVAAETGDAMLGLQSIGDSDPRQLPRYVQRRDDRIKDAFDRLDAKGRTAPEAVGSNSNETVTGVSADPIKPHEEA